MYAPCRSIAGGHFSEFPFSLQSLESLKWYLPLSFFFSLCVWRGIAKRGRGYSDSLASRKVGVRERAVVSITTSPRILVSTISLVHLSSSLMPRYALFLRAVGPELYLIFDVHPHGINVGCYKTRLVTQRLVGARHAEEVLFRYSSPTTVMCGGMIFGFH